MFAYSRDVSTMALVHLTPQEFGFTGDVYVYNYFNKTGWRQPATQKIETSVDSQGSYFVIAPVGQSRIAFLGDLSKFVPASKQRVSSLSDTGQISATLHLRPAETMPIWFFASSTPTVSADHATVSAPRFDSTTGLYQVVVASNQNERATIHFAIASVKTQ